jgi:hypothetical protein
MPETEDKQRRIAAGGDIAMPIAIGQCLIETDEAKEPERLISGDRGNNHKKGTRYGLVRGFRIAGRWSTGQHATDLPLSAYAGASLKSFSLVLPFLL